MAESAEDKKAREALDQALAESNAAYERMAAALKKDDKGKR